MAAASSTAPSDPFEVRLRQRALLSVIPTAPLELAATSTTHTQATAGGHIPNTPLAVATISFLLGSFFTLGFATFTSGGGWLWWTTPQLGFFVSSWAAFHWGEFAATAGWNRARCSVDSFLLDNGVMYHIAHSVAILEYLVTLYFAPSWKAWPYVTGIGIIVAVASQALRSAAMVTASSNFSHAVAFRKVDTHQLVTHGVYAWFRHPSYAGFFYWALASQLVMQNPVSFVGFAIVLWRFFYQRTRYEERALVSFFKEDYEDYRRRVGTKIPFIP